MIEIQIYKQIYKKTQSTEDFKGHLHLYSLKPLMYFLFLLYYYRVGLETLIKLFGLRIEDGKTRAAVYTAFSRFDLEVGRTGSCPELVFEGTVKTVNPIL
jgi:hypothetical protein